MDHRILDLFIILGMLAMAAIIALLLAMNLTVFEDGSWIYQGAIDTYSGCLPFAICN